MKIDGIWWKKAVYISHSVHIRDVHIQPKHKKLIILASKRARTILNAFLECMYLAGRTKITSFDRNFWKCSKITKITSCFGQWFQTFSLTSYAKIFGTFLGFRKGTPVDNKVRNVNVPGFLDRNFWFRIVIFPKIHRSLKILTERIALAKSIRKG